MSKKFEVTLKRSHIGKTETLRKTLEALGLKRINQKIVLEDNLANRGQILKVQHLVDVKVR